MTTEIDVSFTESTRVQIIHSEMTSKLRWRAGTLEQMHWRIGLNAYGQEIARNEEWVTVPEEK